MEKACILIKKLVLIIQLTATWKPTSSASGWYYGQANRYLVNGLMAVVYKNDHSSMQFSDWEGKFIQATPTTNYVINICDIKAVKLCYVPTDGWIWIFSDSIRTLSGGIGRGKKYSIHRTTPTQLPFSWKSHCTSKSHTALAMHFSKHIPIKHHHWNLATW